MITIAKNLNNKNYINILLKLFILKRIHEISYSLEKNLNFTVPYF